MSKSTRQKFWEYHTANPHVYDYLVELARGMKVRGHTRIGISMLFEVMRWKTAMETSDPNSGFKISNSYQPYYARLISSKEDDLDGMFKFNQMKEDVDI